MITLVPKKPQTENVPESLRCITCGDIVEDPETQSLTMHDDPDANYLVFFQYHKGCEPKISITERHEREERIIKKLGVLSIDKITYFTV